jgi:hypothetical protein
MPTTPRIPAMEPPTRAVGTAAAPEEDEEEAPEALLAEAVFEPEAEELPDLVAVEVAVLLPPAADVEELVKVPPVTGTEAVALPKVPVESGTTEVIVALPGAPLDATVGAC